MDRNTKRRLARAMNKSAKRLQPAVTAFKQTIVKRETDIITEVLTDYLKREPTAADAPLCRLVNLPEGDSLLYYNNIELGTICRAMDNGEFSLGFEPKQIAAI